MKKYFIAMGIAFAIICGVIIGAASAHSEAITEYEPTKAEIAEAWMKAEYPDEVYDEIEVTDDVYKCATGNELTTILVWNDGQITKCVSIDMDTYANILF